MRNRHPVIWTVFIVAASFFTVAVILSGLALYYTPRAAEYFLP